MSNFMVFYYGGTLRDDNPYGCTLRCDVFVVVCRVLCTNVVSATSSEHFLVLKLKRDYANK